MFAWRSTQYDLYVLNFHKEMFIEKREFKDISEQRVDTEDPYWM